MTLVFQSSFPLLPVSAEQSLILTPALLQTISSLITTAIQGERKIMGSEVASQYLLARVLGEIQLQHGKDVVRAMEEILSQDAFPDILKQIA